MRMGRSWSALSKAEDELQQKPAASAKTKTCARFSPPRSFHSRYNARVLRRVDCFTFETRCRDSLPTISRRAGTPKPKSISKTQLSSPFPSTRRARVRSKKQRLGSSGGVFARSPHTHTHTDPQKEKRGEGEAAGDDRRESCRSCFRAQNNMSDCASGVSSPGREMASASFGAAKSPARTASHQVSDCKTRDRRRREQTDASRRFRPSRRPMFPAFGRMQSSPRPRPHTPSTPAFRLPYITTAPANKPKKSTK